SRAGSLLRSRSGHETKGLVTLIRWVSVENPLSPHLDGNCPAGSRRSSSCGCRCRTPVHRWPAVGSAPTAVGVLEAVRDAARNLDAPQPLYELIDAAFDDCDQDRTRAAPLTDALLDIRNSSRVRKPRPGDRSDQIRARRARTAGWWAGR